MMSISNNSFEFQTIEAVNCGLPNFVANQGGPIEIIVDGVSGYHIDPNNGDKVSNKMANFFEKCKEDPENWNKISTDGLRRIYEWYKKEYSPISSDPKPSFIF